MGSREGRRASRVVSFNWAIGSGTRSDNIKGQIYIKYCWEMSTHVGKGCRAGAEDQERPLETYRFKWKQKELFKTLKQIWSAEERWDRFIKNLR